MSHILVVDDMAILRDPIAAGLRLAGHTTATADNGELGLQALRSQKFDLLLLDVSMPVMDGLTLLRVIRRDPALAKLPVVLLTALTDKKYVLEAAKLSVREYLLKSRFSLVELRERVTRALVSGSVETAESETAATAIADEATKTAA